MGLSRAPSFRAAAAAAALRLARPLSSPPGGSGGNWRSRGGAEVCPADEGTGREPGSLLSARWGGAGGAPSPRSDSGGLSAGGDCGRRRRRQSLAGKKGKGGESREGKRAGRGSRPGGGARGDGEGAATPTERPGPAGAPPPSLERSPRPGAALGCFGGHRNSGWLPREEGRRNVKPTLPHPGSRSWNGFCAFLSLPLRAPFTPIRQICLMKSSLLPCCYYPALLLPAGGEGNGKGASIKPFKLEPPLINHLPPPPNPPRVTKGEFSPEMRSIRCLSHPSI